jgi:hypothetical protein
MISTPGGKRWFMRWRNIGMLYVDAMPPWLFEKGGGNLQSRRSEATQPAAEKPARCWMRFPVLARRTATDHFVKPPGSCEIRIDCGKIENELAGTLGVLETG